MHEPSGFRSGRHVRHGSRTVLLGHVLVVHYLGGRIQYCSIILPWYLYLDSLERGLHEVAKEDLRQDVGYRRDGSQIQAQGKMNVS